MDKIALICYLIGRFVRRAKENVLYYKINDDVTQAPRERS